MAFHRAGQAAGSMRGPAGHAIKQSTWRHIGQAVRWAADSRTKEERQPLGSDPLSLIVSATHRQVDTLISQSFMIHKLAAAEIKSRTDVQTPILLRSGREQSTSDVASNASSFSG